MTRRLKFGGILIGLCLAAILLPAADARAFYISEVKKFQQGPYVFTMEVQVYGRGSLQKIPLRVTSFKVKIKNEKASSEVLKVKAIRAYSAPETHNDLETLGYTVSPAQWVTKFYRLRKEKCVVLSGQGFFQIEFENFTIRFNPRERKFLGPAG